MDRGRFMRSAVVSLITGACVLALSATAPAASWEIQKLPFQPRFEGDWEIGPLLAISCASRSFCLAAGQYGRIAVSSNPTGGPSAWRVYFGPEETDSSGPPPPPGFTQVPISPTIKGASCPSPSFCIAVSSRGDIYSSSGPGGGTGTWARADIDDDEFETHLEGVSCPTTSFCVAVSGGPKQNNNPRNSGKILSSSNPAGGASAWHITQLDPSLDLRGVSCASPSLCVAVGQEGRIVVSQNPDGGPSAWRDAGSPGGPGHLQGIACTLGPLCVAGDAGGNLLTDADPVGSPAAWMRRGGGGSVPVTGASCPSASQCIAVDNNGDVLTSDDPTGGAGSWSFENVIPYVPRPENKPSLNGMFSVSCPSSNFCAIAAANGTVLTSTNPFEAATPANATQGKRVRGSKRPRTILARVDRKRVRTAKRRLRVRFRFYSVGKARGFVCKRDRRPYRPCSSPVAYWAGLGKHVFRVRAVGRTGLRGPVALDRFRIVSEDSKCPCGGPFGNQKRPAVFR